MKKILSFSLYNKNPKDNLGIIINALLAPKIFTDWVMRVYLDDTIVPCIRKLLETFEHVEIVEMPRGRDGSYKMLWRFLAASSEIETDYKSIMISCDADSYLSVRQKACVDAWLASNKNFVKFVMHCYHSDPKIFIMGGLWGSCNSILPKMKEEVEKYINSGENYDQRFLAENIYPNIKHDLVCFYDDPCFTNKGEKFYGHPGEKENAFPIPSYQEWDEPIPGISWREANDLNKFNCAHCIAANRKDTYHKDVVGGIIDNIPPRALQVIRDYANSKGISLEGCPGI